ncbi:hypothetical protein RHGRI_000926 [Rhododendron griersonianum]|nr:hypothetical protein RHGRI_000926 [Rhododendron griersonianum]
MDESLTTAKGSSRASFCWHFETPSAVEDQTTHNKRDLLASTQAGIWNPDRSETNHHRSETNHQNSFNGCSTGGSRNQTAYTNDSRPHHNTTTEKRDPAATTHRKIITHHQHPSDLGIPDWDKNPDGGGARRRRKGTKTAQKQTNLPILHKP